MKTMRLCPVLLSVMLIAGCNNAGGNSSKDQAAKLKINGIFLTAISNNNMNDMTACLNKGADPDIIVDSRPLLLIAVGKGDYELVSQLLSHGADPNITKNIHRLTPLGLALDNNNFRMARLLISNGADVNMKSIENYPIQIAFNSAIRGILDIPTIEAIIEKVNDINVQDLQGLTPLHYAILITNTNIIGLILKKGGRKEIPTEFDAGYGILSIPAGTTPLKLAVMIKNKDVLDCLGK